MLDIDEVVAQFPGDLRGGNIAVDQHFDIGVFDQWMIGVDTEFAIENRMAIEDSRLHPVLAKGPAEAPRMRQLQTQ